MFWITLCVALPLTVVTFCYVNIYLHYKRSRATLLAHKNMRRRRASPGAKVFYACESHSLPVVLEAVNLQHFAVDHDTSDPNTNFCSARQTLFNHHSVASRSTCNLGDVKNEVNTQQLGSTERMVLNGKEDAERKLLFSLTLILAAFVICWYV